MLKACGIPPSFRKTTAQHSFDQSSSSRVIMGTHSMGQTMDLLSAPQRDLITIPGSVVTWQRFGIKYKSPSYSPAFHECPWDSLSLLAQPEFGEVFPLAAHLHVTLLLKGLWFLTSTAESIPPSHGRAWSHEPGRHGLNPCQGTC